MDNARQLRDKANRYMEMAAHAPSPAMFDQLMKLAADYERLAAGVERGLAEKAVASEPFSRVRPGKK